MDSAPCNCCPSSHLRTRHFGAVQGIRRELGTFVIASSPPLCFKSETTFWLHIFQGQTISLCIKVLKTKPQQFMPFSK